MKRFALPIILFLASLLAGCTVAPLVRGSKLQEDAAPINGLVVQIFAGELGQFENLNSTEITSYRTAFATAFSTRFPEILKANGLTVPVTQVYLGTPPNSLPFQIPTANASHQLILLMTGIRYSTRGGSKDGYAGVLFKARLIETSTKKVVWTSSPSLTLHPHQPNRQTEHFAASIINGLAEAKLIKLGGQFAMDLKGEPIHYSTMLHADK